MSCSISADTVVRYTLNVASIFFTIVGSFMSTRKLIFRGNLLGLMMFFFLWTYNSRKNTTMKIWSSQGVCIRRVENKSWTSCYDHIDTPAGDSTSCWTISDTATVGWDESNDWWPPCLFLFLQLSSSSSWNSNFICSSSNVRFKIASIVISVQIK